MNLLCHKCQSPPKEYEHHAMYSWFFGLVVMNVTLCGGSASTVGTTGPSNYKMNGMLDATTRDITYLMIL
jgi:hypothetical protein